MSCHKAELQKSGVGVIVGKGDGFVEEGGVMEETGVEVWLGNTVDGRDVTGGVVPQDPRINRIKNVVNNPRFRFISFIGKSLFL